MLGSLRTSSVKAAPITAREFLTAVTKLWSRGQQQTPADHVTSQNHRYGLAVSGGVDSMAMAVLFDQVRNLLVKDMRGTPYHDIHFQAFVVDHGLRKDSGREAAAVSSELKKLNITAEILKIHWPQGVKPSELTNFESLARKLRYQTLGRACRDSQLTALFMAHHQDDQAETILMRLMNGHRGSGLAAIKPVADIPECFGIHGVNRSGLLVSEMAPPDHGHASKLEFEDGGIKIFRPLLDFSKERLKATCAVNHTTWFEDPTNIDPSLTTRNAIRHVYDNFILPVPLQKPQLFTLSKSIQRKHEILRDEARMKFHELVEIVNFEPRVGTILVRFPAESMMNTFMSEAMTERHHREHLARLWLQNIIECVTPEEQTKVSRLSIALRMVFPGLAETDTSARRSQAFTVAGVNFQKWPIEHSSLYKDGKSSEGNIWLVSRQPEYQRYDMMKQWTHYPHGQRNPEQVEWQLFDGRYWIRLINESALDLYVRHLRKTDLKQLYNDLTLQDARQLRSLLSDLAPGNIRWTLPAIVEQKPPPAQERVISLPSLGVTVHDISKKLSYTLRYKKVPFWAKERVSKVDI